MKFKYEVSARERGIKALPIAAGFLLLGIFFCFFWWTIIFGIIGVILLLVGAFILLISLLWTIGGGKWDIEINEKEINWQSPFFSEGSFQFDLDEIECVVRRIKLEEKSDGEIKKKIDYSIKGPDVQIGLVNQSGVDLEEVVATLEQLGVKIEEKTVHKK